MSSLSANYLQLPAPAGGGLSKSGSATFYTAHCPAELCWDGGGFTSGQSLTTRFPRNDLASHDLASQINYPPNTSNITYSDLGII